MTQGQRQYSAKEIDDLREFCGRRYDFGSCYDDAIFCDHGCAMGRGYSESERAVEVEQQVRTFMIAGVTAQDLLDEDKQRYEKQAPKTKPETENTSTALTISTSHAGISTQELMTAKVTSNKGDTWITDTNGILYLIGRKDREWFETMANTLHRRKPGPPSVGTFCYHLSGMIKALFK